MSCDELLTIVLAGREILGRSNPALLEWNSQAWRAWCTQDHCPPDPQPASPVLAVAALTCLDDLCLHSGLMQLLQLPGVRANVILVFPTEAALRIARAEAWREGWLGLVTMVAESDRPVLVAGLPAGRRMIEFAGPSYFEESELAELLNLFRAADVSVGTAGAEKPDLERLKRSLSAVLPPLNSLASDSRQTVPAESVAPIVQLRLNGKRIEMPALDPGDDMLATVCPESLKAQPIARLRGDLYDRRRKVELRPPVSLCSPTPKRVRLEIRRSTGSIARSDVRIQVPPAQLEAWMISAFLNRGGAGNPVIEAFARGTGCRIAFAEDEPEQLRDVPVVWGVLRGSDQILERAKHQGLYFFYIDHAYFARGHGKTYRITRNGYEAGPIRVCPSDRVEALGVEILPWRRGGREIILCPPTDYFIQAHGCADWLDTTLAKLRNVTDRPVIVRTKPQPGEAAIPLPQALSTAHALVTHSSNVAIEAACLGTPVFVSPMSAAAPIGLSDVEAIENPVYPDRQPWLAHLAYNQFSFEEIGDGRAWQMLRELELRELA